MNTNQKALELFEQNEYENALELFQQAVKESRNIQSLNNLAWMYSYEEEDDNQALVLIKEVIHMKPSSYFPYNLLGEINLRQKKWKLASMHFQVYFNSTIHGSLSKFSSCKILFRRIRGGI